MKKIISLFVAAVVLTMNVAAAGVTEQQAKQKYQDALEKSAGIQSGVMKMDMKMDVSMFGEEQSVDVSVSSKMKDNGKTMSINTTSSAEGQKAQKVEAYVKNGKMYTKRSDGKYVVADYKTSSTGSMNQLSPKDSKDLYTSSLAEATNFKFSEGENGLTVSYDLSESTQKLLIEEVKSVVFGEAMKEYEKELKKELKNSLGDSTTKESKELVNSMAAGITSMMDDMINSLSFEKISITALVDKNGYVSSQKMNMVFTMENPFSGLAILFEGDPDAAALVGDITMSMTMNYTMTKINQDVNVTMPDFNAGNTVKAA